MSAGIGHNGGPSLAQGRGWRRHAWAKARRDLMPRMPLEVVRRRVSRARALGLDYPTYATVRASTGRDIVGFLLSGNALGLHRAGAEMPDDIVARLHAVEGCRRVGLIDRAEVPPPLDACHKAPGPFATYAQQRARIGAARAGLPADGVILIGAAPWEPDWVASGRLAGFVPAERYFDGG